MDMSADFLFLLEILQHSFDISVDGSKCNPGQYKRNCDQKDLNRFCQP